MSREEFNIERTADQFLPERSLSVVAKSVVPNDPMRAVRVKLWRQGDPMTGPEVTLDFGLSLQERKDLIAFLQSLPDADHPF